MPLSRLRKRPKPARGDCPPPCCGNFICRPQSRHVRCFQEAKGGPFCDAQVELCCHNTEDGARSAPFVVRSCRCRRAAVCAAIDCFVYACCRPRARQCGRPDWRRPLPPRIQRPSRIQRREGVQSKSLAPVTFGNITPPQTIGRGAGCRGAVLAVSTVLAVGALEGAARTGFHAIEMKLLPREDLV